MLIVSVKGSKVPEIKKLFGLIDSRCEIALTTSDFVISHSVDSGLWNKGFTKNFEQSVDLNFPQGLMLRKFENNSAVVNARQVSVTNIDLDSKIVEITKRDKIRMTIRKIVYFVERWNRSNVLHSDVGITVGVWIFRSIFFTIVKYSLFSRVIVEHPESKIPIEGSKWELIAGKAEPMTAGSSMSIDGALVAWRMKISSKEFAGPDSDVITVINSGPW